MAAQLGFYDLMNIAEQNIEETERKSKNQQFVSYTPSGTKKLTPKQKELSANVQKFLARREQEKKIEHETAKRKREHLLELRSQDKKATKRVGQMLRMTKSANKAVISDAMDCLNDSLAEQGEEQQPDEDDYGYVSQYAAEFHKKMMDKYKAIPATKPTKKKSSSLAVPEVQSLGNSKGSNQKSKDSSSNSTIPEVTDNSKKPKEAKKVIPPPPNFNDLLELAKEKCKEPVVIKKPKLDLEEEKYEFGRPMTAKEKAQYLQEKAIRARISVPNFDTKTSDKNNNLRTKGNASSITGKGQPSFKIPSKAGKASVPTPSPVSPSPPVQQVNSKLGPSARVPVPQSSAPPKILSRTLGSTSAQAPSYSQNSKESLKPKTSVSLGAGGGGSKHGSPSGISSKPPKSLPNEKNIQPGKPVSTLQSTSASKSRPPGSYDPQREKPGQRRDRIDIDKHPKHSVPSQRQQEHDRNGPSMQQRNPISNHSDRRREPERSQLPQKSSKHSNLPPPRRELPTSRPGRQIIDSDDDEGEDDYDSEMDDFIDDSDLNGGNISDIIRKITGYDKRRYQDGSDDECMESSAYEQMREESRSLRIGIQEDLEDMRLEQEEKKRKALLAKKRKK